MTENKFQGAARLRKTPDFPYAVLVLGLCLVGCAHTPPPPVATPSPLPRPVSCEDVKFEFQNEEIVARIGQYNVTGAQLNEDTAAATQQEWRTYCQKIQKIRKQALEHRIKIRVIESAAAKEGLELEDWLDKVQEGAAPPSEEEITAFYKAEIPNGEPPLQDIHDEVKNYLTQKNVQVHLMKKMDVLMGAAMIERFMPDVSPLPIAFTNPSNAPVLGEVNAPVTVTVFSDFQCPYCSQIAPVLSAMVQARPKLLKVVFRHFPLSFHENAFGAALFAQCAHAQEQFFPFHDALFATGAEFDRASLWLIAEGLKLDRKALEGCVQSDATRAFIEKDMAAAREIGVSGTPSIFIDGVDYQGGRDLESLLTAVDAVQIKVANEGEK